MSDATTPPAREGKLPGQVAFIIGNEACERFSFYGMKNILQTFLAQFLLVREIANPELRESQASAVYHLFVSGVYFFPLLGGWLADRVLGKYKTILYLSFIYCAGHLCLALFDDNKQGFYLGLFLIALGSGGIKPCVSSLVGDQFDASNKHLASKVFAAFYFSINFGSLFASLFIPKLLQEHSPALAFGIPGALMFVATGIFYAGRARYVVIPPVRHDPDSFMRVVITALRLKLSGAAKAFEAAKERHAPDAVEGVKAVFRILLVFLPIPFFWMLFDQKGSTWVVQAKKMDLNVFGYDFLPSQMQVVNPALVMILIPTMTGLLYPAMKRWGYELTPLRRLPIGMALGALSYVAAGLIHVPIERGETLSILWQLIPYVILTIGEILVSVTGLEFAYSQAPARMKGTLMSLWNLNVTAGNLAVALASALNVFTGSMQFFFYAALAFVAAIALAIIGSRYRMVDQYRSA